MKSRTSLCNPTLLGKNVRRFAPLWIMFFVALLLTGPLYILRNASDFIRYNYGSSSTAYDPHYFSSFGDAGAIFLMLYAVLCAAICFRYLHKTTSAYALHAMPLTRTCQFCTNLISGLLFALAPMTAIALLDWAALSIRAIPLGAGPWLQMLAKWCLQYLFYYGAAVFCMVLSGQTVIGVLSYFALNVIGWLLPAMIQETLVEPLFIGYVSQNFTILSPVVRLAEEGTDLKGAYIYVCAGVGIVLMAAAWLHYRVRHMERAGDAMAYGWAKPVFAVLFSLCFGMFFGMIFGMIFASDLAGYVFWILLGVSLGWIGAQMMLQRTIRIWKKKHWIGLAALLVVMIGTVLCLRYDVLGWQKRVPAAGQIESAEISTLSGRRFGYQSDLLVITDPADVELVRSIQQNAVKAGRSNNNADPNPFGSISYSDSNDVQITYHLKNGTTVKRAYTVAGRSAEIQAMAKDAETLYTKPEYVEQFYMRSLNVPFDEARLEWDGWYYGKEDEFAAEEPDPDLEELVCYDPQRIREAVLEDVRAGRLYIYNSFTEQAWNSQAIWGLRLINEYSFYAGYLMIPDTAVSTMALFGK